MTHSVLEDVVHLGGLALQGEDCLIRAAVHHRGEHGGLTRMENERHHQFLIWRAVLPVWHADLEREGGTDIVVTASALKHYFELKNWTGTTGEASLPGIQRDIDLKLRRWENSYMLITSCNPEGLTKDNFKFLLTRVTGLDDRGRRTFHFPTVNRKNERFEFWLAGWPILQ